MRAKQYCFHVRRASNGEKIVGGTVTAESMDDAAAKVAKQMKLVHKTVTDVGQYRYGQHWFEYRNTEVNVHVTAHPEYLPL